MDSKSILEKLAVYLKDAMVVAVFFVVAAVLVNVYKTSSIDFDKNHQLNVTTITGKNINLRDYRGRAVLIQFWASWCPVCSLEYDSLNNIAEDYPVIGIALNSGSLDEVAAFAEERKLLFDIVNDPDAIIGSQFQVSGVPASFVLDRSGKIRFVEVGYTSEIGLRARLWWAGL